MSLSKTLNPKLLLAPGLAMTKPSGLLQSQVKSILFTAYIAQNHPLLDWGKTTHRKEEPQRRDPSVSGWDAGGRDKMLISDMAEMRTGLCASTWGVENCKAFWIKAQYDCSYLISDQEPKVTPVQHQPSFLLYY